MSYKLSYVLCTYAQKIRCKIAALSGIGNMARCKKYFKMSCHWGLGWLEIDE